MQFFLIPQSTNLIQIQSQKSQRTRLEMPFVLASICGHRCVNFHIHIDCKYWLIIRAMNLFVCHLHMYVIWICMFRPCHYSQITMIWNIYHIAGPLSLHQSRVDSAHNESVWWTLDISFVGIVKKPVNKQPSCQGTYKLSLWRLAI